MTRIKIPRVAKKSMPKTMNCVVVGGVADGLFIKNVVVGKGFIEMSRPTHVKPLESSSQQDIQVDKESDVYEIHPIKLTNSDNSEFIYGICVVQGQSLTWAFDQLFLSHMQKAAAMLREQALQDTHKH